MTTDEHLLLELLNSSPRVHGTLLDHLDSAEGADFARRHGGSGSSEERTSLQEMRAALQQAIRTEASAPESLRPLLDGIRQLPEVTDDGIRWVLDAPRERELAVRAALSWARLRDELPGRLRACANEDCNLFLLDRSRPGTAKWCSMTTCGNRAKARAYATRHRSARDAS